ncbi:sugar ABC transporter permease (plasmid) [Halorarum halophilum]|uniref:Sugar ABC transporter permease n=1 Tax=Halorarum halophilum TaxID=2743090 RepID=A0A7D5GIG5_9EURY|nr:sugar ABC transporter permease [Halobaculum halophilum]QLG29910.1 sugar ABC transporter permease [Halobaculum halophilum]
MATDNPISGDDEFPFGQDRKQTAIRRYRDWLFEILSKERNLALLTILPALILFTLINVLPILWAVSGSFFAISAFSPDWTFIGIANYVDILTDPEFYVVLWRSVVFAGGSVALQLSYGIALAFLLNRTFRFEKVVRAVAMLPYLIPTAVLGFISLWMANSQFGIINQVLVSLGLVDKFIPFYGSPDYAMLAVIVTDSWKLSIFVTIMVLARLQSIPDGFYEAAEVMGATPYEKFRDITLPNLKGVIFIVLLLRSVWMFNKFDIIYILTQGGPLNKTTTVPIWAYETAFTSLKLGKAAAISTLLFVMLIVAAMIYFYAFEPSKEVRVE